MSLLFSRECEYALQATLYLALKRNDKMTSVTELSKKLKVPYHYLGKIFQKLAHQGLLNSDENQETAIKYGIMSIPTLAVFVNGEMVDGVIGAVPKRMLKELMEKRTALVTAVK